MNVSNFTSVNTVANTSPAAASTPQQQPVTPTDTQQKQDSAVVNISEQAQQASRAENQKNAERNEVKNRESKASNDAAVARSAEAAKAQAAQAEASKRVNTFA